jgi:RNA polymerase sigma factor (sigma-70 family)
MVSSWSLRSDAELLRVAGQRSDAFRELYLRYEPIVAGFLQRRTGDAEVTADLTAETFATALLRADRFAGDGPAVGWLLGIARNLHLHQLRSHRAESRARVRLGIERPVYTDASLERVERVVDAGRPGGALGLALAGLPESQREAVLAVVLGEQSYGELAGVLGVEPGTVRQRVSRGLARLRVSIEAGGPRT